MASSFPFRIHEHLRNALHRLPGADPTNSAPPHSSATSKIYKRMPRIQLPKPAALAAQLSEVLLTRTSRREFAEGKSVALADIATLLGSALGVRDNKRPYPSGGGLYPIETYLLAYHIEGLKSGVHHYRPSAHELEYLWSIPDEGKIFSGVHEWANEGAGVIVCTALWGRNYPRYRDFGYQLAILEAGHLGQNILLVAEALGLAACPQEGFDEHALSRVLDIDPWAEQPVYTIPFGQKCSDRE